MSKEGAGTVRTPRLFYTHRLRWGEEPTSKADEIKIVTNHFNVDTKPAAPRDRNQGYVRRMGEVELQFCVVIQHRLAPRLVAKPHLMRRDHLIARHHLTKRSSR